MTRQNSMPAAATLADVADDDVAVTPAGGDGSVAAAELLPALIPLWDMANHTDGVVTNVFNVAQKRVEGAALRDFEKGDQIFIYYGDRRNSNFLIHNGYKFVALSTRKMLQNI